jgi:hypothetical protein
MPCHLSTLKNDYENSSSMPQQHSPLKDNFKNSRKSPHTASHFSIEQFLKFKEHTTSPFYIEK